MILLKKIFLLIGLALLVGCAQNQDFNYGLRQINETNNKYNTTIETYPKSIDKLNSMIGDFQKLKGMKLARGQEPFNYIVDYRMLNLEAEKLYIEGQRYGLDGTTKDGFGCKQRPLILESVSLRNSSASKGFEAVALLKEFVGKYPEEAASARLSLKNALFLNATFYQIYRDARGDSSVINSFCPVNTTMEIYRQEFRKKTNLSEDYINSMDYDEAVKLHKQIIGVE